MPVKELITKVDKERHPTWKDTITLRNLSIGESIVLMNNQRTSVKRVEKIGQFGPYMMCYGFVVFNGQEYTCFMPEIVADAIDQVGYNGCIKVSRYAKENDKGTLTKAFKVEKLVGQSGLTSNGDFSVNTGKSFSILKLTPQETAIFDELWKNPNYQDIQYECKESFWKFSELMDTNGVKRTEEEMKTLWKLFKDFLYAKGMTKEIPIETRVYEEQMGA